MPGLRWRVGPRSVGFAALLIAACASTTSPAKTGESGSGSSESHTDAGAAGANARSPESGAPSENAAGSSGHYRASEDDAGSIHPDASFPSSAGSMADAGPGTEPRSCTLETDLKWYNDGSGGGFGGYQRVTRTGSYEHRTYVQQEESQSAFVSDDRSGVQCTTDLPRCGEGLVCACDIIDALAHPDIAAVLPDGMEFPYSVLNGVGIKIYVGDALISAGAPSLELPPGVEALLSLLVRLEHEQMQACLPDCRAAKQLYPSRCQEPPGCTVLTGWIRPTFIGFVDCDDAKRCAEATCIALGYEPEACERSVRENCEP